MTNLDKFSAVFGFITVIAGIYLIYRGDIVSGISGSIVGGMFLLNGIRLYLKENSPNQGN